MRKDKLIELHAMIYDIHADLEERKDEKKVKPEVSPDDIHKSKSEHKEALFSLGENIADLMNEDGSEFSDIGRLETRMREKKQEIA
ncbi:MAG: UPF0058 family protein [Halobacteria archaeon]